MQIKIKYNKTTNNLTVSNDMEDLFSLATTDIIDNSEELNFEISVNTSAYEESFVDNTIE